MSESKKVDHWAILASELGAAVPEPEISEDISLMAKEMPAVEEFVAKTLPPLAEESFVEEPVAEEPVAELPVVPETPPSPPVRTERPRSSWDLLANELGIEIPPEPEPEAELISEPSASTTPPVVDRSVAEQMFESLFKPQAAEEKKQELVFPGFDSPAEQEVPRFSAKREEERQEPRRGSEGPRRASEEPRRGSKEEKSRRGGRYERPQRAEREEEQARHSVKNEPLDLFLDEDLEEEEIDVAFAQGEETSEDLDEKKKRRRRRRGRKDREKEPEQAKPEKPVYSKAKTPVEPVEEEDFDEFSFFDEPEVPATRAAKEEPEEEDDTRSGKRRRPRRGANKGKKPAETTEQKAPPAKAASKSDDDFWDDDEDELEASPASYSRRGSSSRESEVRGSREVRPTFRSIPTWDEAIGMLVSKNMESRGKGQSQNRGHGQSRGGRRDNRR